ncbi:hypothetical protein HDV03_002399 [Kappamyces sp. JEL0829]|nr:hypothetical protein HDV03_002399 [Kappamyces sp. JEL0829]
MATSTATFLNCKAAKVQRGFSCPALVSDLKTQSAQLAPYPILHLQPMTQDLEASAKVGVASDEKWAVAVKSSVSPEIKKEIESRINVENQTKEMMKRRTARPAL